MAEQAVAAAVTAAEEQVEQMRIRADLTRTNYFASIEHLPTTKTPCTNLCGMEMYRDSDISAGLYCCKGCAEGRDHGKKCELRPIIDDSSGSELDPWDGYRDPEAHIARYGPIRNTSEPTLAITRQAMLAHAELLLQQQNPLSRAFNTDGVGASKILGPTTGGGQKVCFE